MRVIFTSSVAMAVHSWAHDLARRARIFRMGTLSLGEYLQFANADGGAPAPLSLAEAVAGQWTPAHLRAGAFFEEYLRGGMLPFARSEPSPLPLLRGILEKVVAQDIAAIGKPQVGELPIIRKLVDFVVESMSRIGAEVQYLKGQRGQKTPDYLVTLPSGRMVFEVGGKGKGREQFKGFQGKAKPVILAHSLIPEKGRIPLHLLGLVMPE